VDASPAVVPAPVRPAVLEPAPEALPEALEPAAAELVARGVAEETRRGYAGDLRRYEAWCAVRGLPAYPASPERLVNYVAHLAGQGKAPSSMERALAAILTAHRLRGFPRPDTKAARVAIKSARRERAEAGGGPRKATAATVSDLRAMVTTVDAGRLIGLRDRAVIVIGFAGMLRRSEVAALSVTDVVERPEGLEFTIRYAKTDQAGEGRIVALPYGSFPETCPVRTLAAWRTAAGISEGPLFRRVDRHGHLLGPMTGQAVSMVIDRAAERAGLAGRYTGHSLRRGGATAARRAGHDLVTIARHGRWKDGSPVLLGYLEDADRWTDNPMQGVGL
jgi:site-specific recombinase XerD